VSREVALTLALGALAVAALCVSVGSFVLLWAERRDRRRAAATGNPGPDPSEAPEEPPASGASFVP
jgi:hypothetical protein